MRDQSGYKKLIVWRLAKELRSKIYQTTSNFRNQEFKRVNQTNDAARSFKQNIQEGYKRGSTSQFIQSLDVSAGSLAEVRGDIEDYFEDGLITEDVFDELDNLTARADYLLGRLIKALREKNKR